MAARRLIFILLVLLMISSFAAALVPVERSAREESSSSTTTEIAESTAPAPGKLVVRRIEAGERPQTVRIRLGDQLQLAVAAEALDEIEIPALGEVEPVDPDSPALFDLLPLEAGSYDLRLVNADRVVGSIEVEAAGPAAMRRSEGTPPEKDADGDEPGAKRTQNA